MIWIENANKQLRSNRNIHHINHQMIWIERPRSMTQTHSNSQTRHIESTNEKQNRNDANALVTLLIIMNAICIIVLKNTNNNNE